LTKLSLSYKKANAPPANNTIGDVACPCGAGRSSARRDELLLVRVVDLVVAGGERPKRVLAVRVHDEDRILDHLVLTIGVAAGDAVEPLCVLPPVAAKRNDVEDVVGAVDAVRRPAGEVVAVVLDLVEEVVRVAQVGVFADGLAERCPGRLLDGRWAILLPRHLVLFGTVAVHERDCEWLNEPGEVLLVLRVADERYTCQ
jgi:hypothetical protein